MSHSNKKKSKLGRILVLLLLIAVIIAGGGLVYVHSLGDAYDSSADEIVSVEIPQGSSTSAIATILEKNGIIGKALDFRIKSRIDGKDGTYKTGVYELSASMDMDEIMNIIINGAQSTLKLTIPEGYTVKQIAQAVEETGTCSAADFLNEAENGQFDYDFIADAAAAGSQSRLEGFLYPDTYELFKTEDAHSIIERMISRFNEIYDQAKLISSTTVPYDSYSMYQIVTIASLIEREVKLDNERQLVSSVIYNRLNDGMKLQFCSTVQYALGEQKARLYNSDLQTESPYNTYLYAGLPVGPIASPGKASIEAALNPAITDYLYFVVNSSAGDGSHNFAASGSDFNAYRDEYLASLTN